MADPLYLTIRLPLRIGPMERSDFWEDPIDQYLEATNIGEVSGGGTMMSKDGEIEFCDIEIAMQDLSAATLEGLQKVVHDLGAPKGTKFLNDKDEVLADFGEVRVVGIGLDGTSLPDSAYEGFDPEGFCDEIVAALGEGYAYGGSNAGAQYTFFYFHGSDNGHIEKTLRAVTSDKPICEGAQFIHIA